MTPRQSSLHSETPRQEHEHFSESSSSGSCHTSPRPRAGAESGLRLDQSPDSSRAVCLALAHPPTPGSCRLNSAASWE